MEIEINANEIRRKLNFDVKYKSKISCMLKFKNSNAIYFIIHLKNIVVLKFGRSYIMARSFRIMNIITVCYPLFFCKNVKSIRITQMIKKKKEGGSVICIKSCRYAIVLYSFVTFVK